ncbi:MAG TPA: chemotaxis protein CheW [Coleofasciculaceae cyanobacterium]
MTSSLSRRSVKRRAEATQKLIVFSIQQEWFTLPIQAAEKVIVLDQVYGSPDGQGLRFTHYQDQEILVIDAKQRIFGSQPPQLANQSSIASQASDANPQLLPGTSATGTSATGAPAPTTAESLNYLLIVRDAHGELMGLPLESQPTLRQVPISAFKPLPPAYLAEGKIRCISALVISTGAQPPLLLLNLDQLLYFQTRSLPPSA